MIHEFVTNYINLWESKVINLNKERVQLIKLVQKEIVPQLKTGEVYFDEKQIEQCVRFIERWYFPLKDFQRFIIAFVFLMEKNDNPNYRDKAYFKEFLIMMGRGGGKNGFISALTHYFLSELHGIDKYDVSIVANSEEQAKTSFEEIYNTVDSKEILKKAFRITKTEIESRKTRAKLKFKTSNAKTKDGGREGAVIFDEIHEYENALLVNTLRRGLGKVPHDRTFYIGTDGYVREGYLDNLKNVANNILDGEAPGSRMFPFICKLDNEKEVFEEVNWPKANPMFEYPLSEYADNLLDVVRTEYASFGYDSTARADFMTKRMNLPEEDLEKIVAPFEVIKRGTNKPMPLLNNRQAIVGIDFATTRDFTAAGFLFKIDGKFVWHTHSWARKEFLDKTSLGPPIEEWEKEGLLTIVDAPTLSPELMADWVRDESKRLNIKVKKVMVDRFRYDLVKPAFDKVNLEVELLRFMPSVHAQVAPIVEIAFNNEQIIWGDNPLMRWYTNNTAVKIKKDGNKEYIKKDEVRRKTDGFNALIHALFKVNEISDRNVKKSIDYMKRMLG